MEIDSLVNIGKKEIGKHRSQQIEKQQAATDFVEIFARKLVKEMTKDSFKMGDKNGALASSNNLYRKFITDTLAGEIAARRKLGMADLVSKYWSQS